ncbi:NAD(P)/FAD-dependent oxidoreductase [Variovorax sp. RCC_210]|uniref:NAD(P)/FAD-dependent oxidoreductase n=1 Tax=Variovorax sp. RCC_210 TaxID=3239217 RepID=UPI003525B9C7
MRKKIVIVGGGIIGSSIACHLASQGLGGHVVVFEPDPTYARSSTTRSASALRMQFNLGINVAMSRYGHEFFSNANAHLSLGHEFTDVKFEHCPYLVLSAPEGLSRMRLAHQRQLDNGGEIDLLVSAQEFERVKWLKTDGLGAATLGRTGEGWLEPLPALQALRRKAESLGVAYIAERATGFDLQPGHIAGVEFGRDEYIEVETVINAAGAQAAQVAAMASVPLPIEARKRSAFVFRSANPPVGFTNLVDPTFANRGIYARPYHGDFLAVTSPAPEVDHHTDDMAADLSLFDDIVRPGLARRVVGFEDIQLVDAWAGHYEINTFDQNGIIGRHPEIHNFVLACGFSGHGVMHAPAVGRGVSELLTTGGYKTLDLTPFRFERIAQNMPLDDVQASEHRQTAAGV